MTRQGYMFRLTIIIAIVVLIIAYAIFNTRLIIRGPSVHIYDLVDGQIIEGDGLVEIKGEVQNATYISLNGRQIFVDEKDHTFEEKFLLTSRINYFEIFVSDKFGKTDRKKMILVYKDSKEIDIPEQIIDIPQETQEEGIEEQPQTQEEPAGNT